MAKRTRWRRTRGRRSRKRRPASLYVTESLMEAEASLHTGEAPQAGRVRRVFTTELRQGVCIPVFRAISSPHRPGTFSRQNEAEPFFRKLNHSIKRSSDT